mmetsp:Transcript_24455/g.56312  ORF Transcript_24455/g.56312 Transcript_24455/m.56312 type:complete len:215 (-) Transcript_24455:97-741(-)
MSQELDDGWEKRESRSQPGVFYYVHPESGKTSLEPPLKKRKVGSRPIMLASSIGAGASKPTTDTETDGGADLFAGLPEATSSTCEVEKKIHEKEKPVMAVTCLHLLKKHVGSRRPSSWREKVITRSLEEATYLLKELRKQIAAVSDVAKQREEFEKLARKESDCGSATEGGSLGKFGRGKMQPAFEQAAFALKVNELSQIVNSESGVHIILRVE